ncbi:uncharacterized protein LOC119766650 [Culex quinquefasciatus]|uniref:uncharacterized protein LOC119766650 n=1 Tax=Culex quinquefasciatus TaxID=7176 RepID=UPI0018E38917|nr:uncharacterized protein LOC119766650 [Culex quinquefasciatus]
MDDRVSSSLIHHKQTGKHKPHQDWESRERKPCGVRDNGVSILRGSFDTSFNCRNSRTPRLRLPSWSETRFRNLPTKLSLAPPYSTACHGPRSSPEGLDHLPFSGLSFVAFLEL